MIEVLMRVDQVFNWSLFDDQAFGFGYHGFGTLFVQEALR